MTRTLERPAETLERPAETLEPSAETLDPPPPLVPTLTSAQRQELARRHGLRPVGVRPSLWAYTRDVLSRAAFIRVLGTATAYSRNQHTYLGQLWALLNPVLNATVYVLIFGIILRTGRGVENTVAFIVIGVFLFRFVEQSVHGGAQSIARRVDLLRSLRFPRAVLPIANVTSHLATLAPALGVMCLVVLGSGLLPGVDPVRVTPQWLLLLPAVALLGTFTLGVAFVMARLAAVMPDLNNVIPFVLRFVMYGSGVIFPVVHYAERLPDAVGSWVAPVLELQPVAVYLYLGRSALMDEEAFVQEPVLWAFGVVWAVVSLVGGFVVFWRGEQTYGRD
ncbi:ABC transporter permease [Isoptericola halotolerans]|uniref:Transport permease protein n=1 Tax=Isoptericola halotolerans TaxID=300560 RepID=A0ABX2A9M0_9MICO|nr:ABC transporter permease [Isoptericola halotolerans]NOV98491.1 teichoic acid transport system permease protein [Isoptericola halotolerans]